jgi:LCP family protein required for cell wall assembly
VLAVLSVIALTATGYAYATLNKVQDNVHTTDALNQVNDPQAPPADDGANDILLVGTDARTDMQGNPLPLEVLKQLRTEEKSGINTDTLIVLRIPKDGSKPTGVSIPRDTWVDVSRGGQAKINSVFGVAKVASAADQRRRGVRDQPEIERESDQAGRRALVRAVQDFTQIRIDHYAEVNLLGFYLLTEALGGVKVCLNHATQDKDSGADFRAGPQTVSGGEALSFVRQRKNLPRGDLDRIVRQQTFLASALHQVLSAGTLTNPVMLNQLTDAVHRSLVLDPDLDLLQFAEQTKGIASGALKFVTIPVITAGGRSPDGQSIVEVDLPAVRQFVAAAAGRAVDPIPAGGIGGGGSTGSFAPAADVAPAVAARTGDVSCVN